MAIITVCANAVRSAFKQDAIETRGTDEHIPLDWDTPVRYRLHVAEASKPISTIKNQLSGVYCGILSKLVRFPLY